MVETIVIRPRRLNSLRFQTALLLGVSFAAAPLLLLSRVLQGVTEAERPAEVIIMSWFVGSLIVLLIAGFAAIGLTTLLFSPVRSALIRLTAARSIEEVELVRGQSTVTEIRHLLDGVHGAVAAHDELWRGKVAYLAALVHDLRTRVTGIALLDAQEPDRRSRDAEAIQDELRAVQAWLGRILDAVRVDQLETVGERETIEVSDFVRKITFDTWNVRPGVTVTIQGSATAHLDQYESGRAIFNLVSNAVRAARSSVTIEVFPGLIRISDDGTGLPLPLDILTQPFRRAGSGSQVITTTGVGLGLFIARRILEMHGGKLACERSDDRGTVLLAYLGG